MSSDLPSTTPPDGKLTGTVVAVQANYYFVQLDTTSAASANLPPALHQPQQLLCTRRTRLKKIGQKVMVGDQVVVDQPDWQGKRGAISQVLPRSSQLDRPPIANANQILLVFAIEEPTLDPHQLTRFLVKAESTGLQICLCLSKCDLIDAAAQAAWHDRLKPWGYDPVFISTYHGIGLEQLKQQLRRGMTIVSGPSGVGKSSLINQLIPAADLRVSEVSGKLGRGRHTTRHVELFELADGGLLADTPGFNQPDLDCSPEALTQYFPEIAQRLQTGNCQFNNCRHHAEPGCVVQGEWERYPLYVQFLTEAIERQQQQQQQADPDAIMKRKVRGKDQVTYEPRLNRHKYRQESRRSTKQSVQVMKGRVEDFLDHSDQAPDEEA
ncbi:small ribosomal subunit biogenesis GTPase RsgA [filamentous cyanobacterium LEGE 11480]|uniref:Small ribosomal subunit biogenesis GTPase RsgA n=1 Tax=Romeriopsis navalis LEGE 11480 TaxID=2777977 RepID=A0A928VMQ3_9CYAN|nr:small ribosomal subunit biogenesis GTPase RsgA [Romeriopsis navalis]MBE9031155.1 small ribosomal subunit biogenesis GTPase RsgA [Romeriopsis navalis LEGE 11480]